MKIHVFAAMTLLVGMMACVVPQADSTPDIPTPDIPATVTAQVQAQLSTITTATPPPTHTPYPTATEYPTPTQLLTLTPYSRATPAPTSTPYPTATAAPTATPYPTATAYPTSTPFPTQTPYPTIPRYAVATPSFQIPVLPTFAPIPTITIPRIVLPTLAPVQIIPWTIPTPTAEEEQERLVEAMYDCFESDPEFAEDFIAGLMEEGASRQLAELFTRDRETFRELMLLGLQDDPEMANLLVPLAPLLELECGS